MSGTHTGSKKLDDLLRTLEEKYLLIETEGRAEPSAPRVAATRLAHDTLAPVVRREFQESTAPGQRARRLLENRAREWKDGKTGHPLDAADLATVEAGAEGMRAWTEDEGRLVDASRQAESRRQAEEAERQADRIRKAEAEKQQETERRLHAQQKFNRWLGLLVLSLFLVSIIAGRFWFTSERSTAEQRRSTTLSANPLRQGEAPTSAHSGRGGSSCCRKGYRRIAEGERPA